MDVLTNVKNVANANEEHESMTDELKNYWVSWWQRYEYGAFEIHSPWWWSGSRDIENDKEEFSIVAAIKARNTNDAKKIIYTSYDNPVDSIEFRFCTEFDKNQSPYSERFAKADWMKWE